MNILHSNINNNNYWKLYILGDIEGYKLLYKYFIYYKKTACKTFLSFSIFY